MVTRWLLVTTKHSQSLVLNKSSVLHRMTLIDHAHSFQFMEKHNLGITTLKHALCPPNVFKNCQKANNYQFYLPNFLKFCENISQKLLRPSQFLEKFMEIPELSTSQK